MKIKIKFWKEVLLMIAVVIMLFGLGELLARIFYFCYADYNTEMWRYARELKQLSLNKSMSHEHRPGKEGNFYGVNIKINSQGWRDFEFNKEKSDNVYRILVLGDSITFGWGVKLEDTFAKRLERRLNENSAAKKYEVINAGVGNYNTQMELEMLASRGLAYKPDLVILSYYINDAEPTEKIHFIFWWLKKSSYLYAFAWDKLFNLSYRFKGMDNYYDYYQSLYSENGKNLTRSYIKQIINLNNNINSNTLVINIPEMHNFKDYKFTNVTEFVKNVSEENDAQFIDLLPFFANYTPQDLWVSPADPHTNSLANRIISDILFEKIKGQ